MSMDTIHFFKMLALIVFHQISRKLLRLQQSDFLARTRKEPSIPAYKIMVSALDS